jgi:acetyl/propionyl-CoA carboxylase alpha subunit
VFETVLVADRGAGATRLVETCQRLGARTVVAHSAEDESAPHVRLADEAVPLGGRTWAESYGDPVRLLEAARRTRAQAVHPGGGWLSLDPVLARAVVDAGLEWLGPPPGVLERTPEQTAELARSLGLEMAEAGGRRLVVTLMREGATASCLGIREQILDGGATLLDVEPADLTPGARDAAVEAATAFAAPAGLTPLCAVELALTPQHGVRLVGPVPVLQAGSSATCVVAGVDLVELHLRIGADDEAPVGAPRGGVAAVAHVRAVDRFAGRLRRWKAPANTTDVQVDTAVGERDLVTAVSDRLLAVVTVAAPDRDTLMARIRAVTDEFVVEGVPTTLPALQHLLDRREDMS